MPHAVVNPRKRSRRHAGDEDDVENVLEVRQATSNLRGTARKRPRLSDTRANGKRRQPERNGSAEHEDSDDDDNNDDRNGSGGKTTSAEGQDHGASDGSPARTQYELKRDGDYEHLRHEEEDDQLARENLEKKDNEKRRWALEVERVGNNHTAENGVLESITCVNFMCHKQLHCELGPLLNFIVGENGSGKSAILTAITLCLGGKATSTNRGGSLKSFIREGCDRAVLIVKIKNQGIDAFNHDIYGDTIIVERAFSKAGTSGFKIKTATGQTYSTKKNEVDDIVEYFGLQVDNPLNVLSQDNARQFLSTSTKEQKYKFFYEGVLLAQLDKDYQIVQETVEVIDSKIPDQQERLKQGEKEVAAIEKLKAALEGNRHLHDQRLVLRDKIIWAQVGEQERALAACAAELEAKKAKVADTEKEIEERRKILGGADEAIAKTRSSIEAAQEEADKRQAEEDEKRGLHDAAKEKATNLHREERDAKMASAHAKAQVVDTKAKIEIEKKRLEDATGSGQAQLVKELADTKKAMEDRQNEIASQRALEEGKKLSLQGFNEAMGRAKSVAEAKRREVDNAKRHVRQLESKQISPYAGYEARMQNLVGEIERDTGFAAKPVGPIGFHVKLLKPEWLPILESFLNRHLNSFVVTSMNDQKRLQQMMSRVGVHHSPIIVARNTTINTAGKEPDAQFDTILRVLKIDSEIVRNQLIINNAIEQIILIADRADADRVMFHEQGPPHNVKACLTLNKHRPGTGFRLMARASGGSTAPIDGPKGRLPRIIADSTSQLTLARDTLQQLEVDEAEAKEKARKVQEQEGGHIRELQELTENRARLERLVLSDRVTINRVEEQLDDSEGADGRLRSLQEVLEDLVRQREHHSYQAAELIVQKESANEEVKAAWEKFREAKHNAADAHQRVRKAEVAAEKAKRTRDAKLRDLKRADEMLEALQEELDSAEASRTAAQGQLDEWTANANKETDKRVAVGPNETSAGLRKHMDVVDEQLKAAKAKAGMTEKQAAEQLAKAREMRDQYLTSLRNTQLVNDQLKRSLELRLERWRFFQRHISARARQTFMLRLGNRGFAGKLSFDHVRRRLDLHVEPHKDEQGPGKQAPARNTKTLSGGEKSFSSICLLLSIWDAMNSPLRCLDEFDVFMDNVNRAISTRMLIDAARMATSRQFIFITPNAIEGQQQNLGKDVKIIRLTDPRQRRLTDL